MNNITGKLAETLRDVLKYGKPCGHSPPDECCTTCHAWYVLWKYDEEKEKTDD